MSFGPVMRFTVGELRIELAPIAKDDLGAFIDPKNDHGMNRQTVNRFMGHLMANTIEDEQKWHDSVIGNINRVVWGIWLLEGDKRTLIGNSALNEITNDHIRQATSGSMIFRKEYWGKGIASAAHKARTWYAFQQLGLHRIMSAVIFENGGSMKALSRSGYALVYVERNTLFVDGRLHHQNNLECLNPNEPFWSQWWHGERPSKRATDARQLTRESLKWAEENVELL